MKLFSLVALLTASARAEGGDSGWSTDFAAGDGVFLIDDGAVSHCPQCVFESATHVSLGADAGGALLRLDQTPCNPDPLACCDASGDGVCARFATGHMRSASAQAFGTFSFIARPAFAAGAAPGAPPPNNSFTCLTTSFLAAPHHEVASCFHGDSPTEVSLAYWSPSTDPAGVVLKVDTGVALHEALHSYSVTWTPTFLSLSLDGKQIANASAAPNTTIPWLAGQALLINRVLDEHFDGPALVQVRSASYSPLAAQPAAPLAAQPAAAPTVPPAMPWIQVRAVDRALNPAARRRFVLADEFGREVTLRGANLEFEERNLPPGPGDGPTQRPIDPQAYADGRCPNNTNGFQEPPICGVDAGSGKYNASGAWDSRNDLAQARAYGLNFVRLCLSWSELEPEPGQYSSQYIERIAQVVAWAEEQDVYVLLDMHEDLYSRFIEPAPNQTQYPPYLTDAVGQDGAPAWAVKTDGWPSLGVGGQGNLNLAMMKAFQNFYENALIPGLPQGAAPGRGLQDHYIGAIAALASRFKNSSTVLGIELLNEPQPGTTLPPLAFGELFLYPLYKRVVQALTGERDGLPDCTTGVPYFNRSACAYPDLGVRDTRHPIFFEPSSLRNLIDFTPQISAPLTNYSQLVYTPHVYSFVFTLDFSPLNFSWPPSFDYAFDTAWDEANAIGAAVLITEFGGAPSSDAETLAPTLAAQDRAMTGGSIWSFKSNCVDGGSGPVACPTNAWVLYYAAQGNATGDIAQNGPPVGPMRQALVSRTYSRGVVGETLSYSFDNVTLGFALTAHAAAAGAGAAAGPSAPTMARLVTVSAANYSPAMSRRRGAGAPLQTEVYVPPTLANFSVAVAGAATLAEVTAWPDGSRTAFVSPGPSGGVYSVAVAAAAAEARTLAGSALLRHGAGVGAGGGAGCDGSSGAAELATQRALVLDAVEARFEAARSAARLVGIELG